MAALRCRSAWQPRQPPPWPQPQARFQPSHSSQGLPDTTPTPTCSSSRFTTAQQQLPNSTPSLAPSALWLGPPYSRRSHPWSQQLQAAQLLWSPMVLTQQCQLPQFQEGAMEPFEESSRQSCGCWLTAGKYTPKKSEEARSHAPQLIWISSIATKWVPKSHGLCSFFQTFYHCLQCQKTSQILLAASGWDTQLRKLNCTKYPVEKARNLVVWRHDIENISSDDNLKSSGILDNLLKTTRRHHCHQQRWKKMIIIQWQVF